MCGIVGYKTVKPLDQYHLEEATSLLAHRGPDAGGVYTDAASCVGLGHRRLSILDLSDAGRQPMSTRDGLIRLSFNGEVYNFKEIRRTLERKGHHFDSNSDAEVVLNAYREWGPDCLERFTGMFALAVWDQSRETLFLARDRLGIKPLYYYYDGKNVLFASELKALTAFPLFQKEIDEDALSLYLHYQYVPAPSSIFKNTFKLMPGEWLSYKGGNIKKNIYWEMTEAAGPAGSDIFINEEESISGLDDLLTKTVSDHLVSDVPVGALLSGGIDSSLVAALMQKTSPKKVKTFSIGFREEGYNEAPWAAKVARCLGTDHTEMYISSKDALALIPRLPDIYCEPFADSSGIPTFLVSRLVRSRVTVALSGDGGDEQFAGYVRYWMTCSIHAMLEKLPRALRISLSKWLPLLPVTLLETVYSALRDHLQQRFRVADFTDKWNNLLHLLTCTDIRQIYRVTHTLWPEKDLLQMTGRTIPPSSYETAFNEAKTWSPLAGLMHADRRTYLPDAMLTKVDRASMAVGLEVRVPLIDHRVIEFSARLPDHLKYRHGRGKYILKKMLSRYVPPTLFERPKMGFGMPLKDWLRGDLSEMLRDYLSENRLKKEGRFHSPLVQQRIDEHQSGAFRHQDRLWALLMWEMWRERWLGN